jgi:hypothetical protein
MPGGVSSIAWILHPKMEDLIVKLTEGSVSRRTSSIVLSMMYRITVTGLPWPSLKMRPIA